MHELYERPLKHLFGTLDKRMSAALIAPAGTGKTMLLRALMARLPQARYRVHYVKVTDLSKRLNGVTVANDILAMVESLKGRLIPEQVEVEVTRNYGETAQEKVNASNMSYCCSKKNCIAAASVFESSAVRMPCDCRRRASAKTSRRGA